MSLPPKTVQCRCGHTVVMEVSKHWCEKCNRPMFYREKDQRWNTLNQYFVIAVFCGAASFLTYVFLELYDSWTRMPLR